MKKNTENDYLSLTHFFSKALFLGIGISKILIDSKESAIFSLILGSLSGIIIIYFISKIKYNHNIIMFITIFILFIIGLTEFANLITSIYLLDMNKFLIVLSLILIILYMNSKDIYIHLKLSRILLYFSFILFILGYIVLIPNINYLNYFPLNSVSFKKIIFTSMEFALFTTVPNILYGGISINIERKKVIKNYILSNIILIIIILIIEGTLGINLISLFRYPEYVVFKKINILNFIQNLENILSYIWLFTIFIYLSICSKEMYDITYKMFNKKYIYPIFIIISLFFITNFLFDNLKYSLFLYNNLWLILLIILLVYIFINLKKCLKNL